MPADLDYKLERFEEYFGDIKQVKKTINSCKICGGKLVHTHLSDYKNFIIQETSRCPECGNGANKKIHVLN